MANTLTYGRILANAALRLGGGGSIVGSSTAQIEANFNQVNFGAAHVDNPAFPFSALRDAVVMAEEQIALAIASTRNHPLRAVLKNTTPPLAAYADIPKFDKDGAPIIGEFGAVRDAATKKICTINRIRKIERLINNPNDWYQGEYFYYNYADEAIIHTRPSVRIEVCSYSRAARIAAAANNQETLFPDALEYMYLCGTIKYCFRPDESPETNKYFGGDFDLGLAEIKQGRMPSIQERR
jgi:hypothetical protein